MLADRLMLALHGDAPAENAVLVWLCLRVPLASGRGCHTLTATVWGAAWSVANQGVFHCPQGIVVGSGTLSLLTLCYSHYSSTPWQEYQAA